LTKDFDMNRKSLLYTLLWLIALIASPALSLAQVTTLRTTGDSITAVLSGAAATTNPTISVTYRINQGQGIASGISRTNGATPVPVLSGQANGLVLVDQLIVYNADTAAVTLTLNKISSAVTYQIQSVTIPSLATFTWNREHGIRLTDNNGQALSTLSSGLMSTSIGASTAAAGTTTTDAGVLPAGTATTYPTTAANGTTGVRINAADKVTGRMLFIGNGVSNQILKVYAPSGGTINGAAGDAAFSSVSGKGVVIQCLNSAANTWLAW
jgi:hypothetical protein